MLQDELHGLRRRLNALQQGQDPQQARESLLPELGGLQRSLEELQSVVQGLLQADHPQSPACSAECQRNEESLRESEARKAAIIEAAPDGVITIDPQGCVLEFNAAAETLFGLRLELTLGRALVDLIVPPRLRKVVLAGLKRYQISGKGELLGKRFMTFAMKADGSEFPVEIVMAPIGIGEPSLLTVFVYDATARRNAEQDISLYQERLRSLAADMLLTEERERRRLAVDLHDGLSQSIALARMKLGALRLSVDASLAKSLDEIESLIEHANLSASAISFELSPPVLHDLGLQPALQWLVENIQTRYGIEVLLEDDGQPKPADEKTRVILFRSIRELLINAAKHAGTRRVRLRLARDENQLDAAVEDDGVGMETDVATATGSGLFSIRERLSQVGGRMSIESAPGQGTRIRLCAPLEKETPRVRVQA